MKCEPSGRLTACGTLPSDEEKLAVSHHLRRLDRCTSGANLITVPSVPRDGNAYTRVSANGKKIVPIETMVADYAQQPRDGSMARMPVGEPEPAHPITLSPSLVPEPLGIAGSPRVVARMAPQRATPAVNGPSARTAPVSSPVVPSGAWSRPAAPGGDGYVTTGVVMLMEPEPVASASAALQGACKRPLKRPAGRRPRASRWSSFPRRT